MKRGNTALKRGVGLASAFALAIAGAVVAAPAASAAVTNVTSGLIRATPTADAAALSDPYSATATYGDTLNAAAPVVGVGTGRSVADVQVQIAGLDNSAGADASALFADDDTVTLTLSAPSGVEFATRPTASLSGIVNLDDLDNVSGTAAGHKATPMPAALVDGAAPTISAGSPVANPTTGPKNEVTLTLSGASQTLKDGTTGGFSNAGYLIDVAGLRVNVAKDAQPGVITVSADAGTSTAVIGYVAPYSLSITGDTTGYPANAKGDAALPNFVVTETSTNGFQGTTAKPWDYSLAITGKNAKDATFVASDPTTVSPSAKIDLGNGLGKDAPDASKTDVAATDDVQSLTFKGASVKNYLAGSAITVGLVVKDDAGDSIFDTPASESTFANTKAPASVLNLSVNEVDSPNRTAGNSRYDTAKKIAAEYGTSNAVVLANGLDAKLGIDALAANYLAGAKSAPILLTDSSDNLPQATKDAIAQVVKAKTGTVTVYVLGKTDSVSDAAADQAKFVATAAADKDATVKVVRLGGDNRYETAAAALKEAGSSSLLAYNLGSGSYYTAFLASGEVNADALAAGALSAGSGIPVLLTNGTSLDADEAAQVKDMNIQQLIVLGSTDRVSDALIDTLKADNGVKNVVRVAGTGSTGRYDTAAALNELAITSVGDKGLGVNINGTAYLANGTDGFADALTVGPLAGKNTNPVLTVPKDSLPANAKKFLTDHKSVLTDVSALGQSDRISDAVITEAQKAIL